MRYLIDGHNLIPKLGIHLESIDDEEVLISRLQAFCLLHRSRVEVFFDGAPPGYSQRCKVGSVVAHFVRQGSSADEAIESRLKQLGKEARNWTVVSSDGRVQSAGRSSHAAVISSDEFARFFSTQVEETGTPKREQGLSPEEVDDWLSLFNIRKD